MTVSGPKRVREFDEYLTKLTEGIHVEGQEKKELLEEWYQHLHDHYQSLKKKGAAEDEAIHSALEQFGDIEMLQKEVNQTYPSSMNLHIQKEVMIVAICFIAALIGPVILIGASPQLLPPFAVLFAYFLNRYVVSRMNNPFISLIGFLAIYSYFVYLFADLSISPLTLDFYVSQLFSLQLDRLAGSSGLFEFVTIHMMWYVMLLVKLLSNCNYIPLWKRFVNSTFQFWAMVFLGVFFARFQGNAEGVVLYLNTFLLYGFLQQVISVSGLKMWIEKLNMYVKGME